MIYSQVVMSIYISPQLLDACFNLFYLADMTNKTFFRDIVGHGNIKILIIAKVTHIKLLYSVDKGIFKTANYA